MAFRRRSDSREARLERPFDETRPDHQIHAHILLHAAVACACRVARWRNDRPSRSRYIDTDELGHFECCLPSIIGEEC